MASNTSTKLRNQVLYQIFIRNFSEEGTFKAVNAKLDAIKEMGIDIIWFAPIHPIGVKSRKGTLGSPYAIKDYRAVNPEYGTLDDFKELVNNIHERGMKCIIDVVYNHTSPDSVLIGEHPEWFYHKEDGSFGNRVGDWSDIIDLDYSNKELWDYQIETLKMWAETVDGFRCDVAPMVPVEFWKNARSEVAKVNPDCIWLAESIEPEFLLHLRSQGINALSDSEIYRAFDISYEYDNSYGGMRNFLQGHGTLSQYAEYVNRQEYTYPNNYVKLRFLENHDVPRAAFMIPDRRALINWTAFLFFQKGMPLIYAGQEIGASHLPGLFDKDTVDWHEDLDEKCCGCHSKSSGFDLRPLIRLLSVIKKAPIFADSTYNVKALNEEFLVATHQKGNKFALGVFAVKGTTSLVMVDLPDGIYKDLISGEDVEVTRGQLGCFGRPIIIICEK